MNVRYVVQAVGFKIFEGENDKAPQVGVELRVVEGPEAGKTVFWYGSLKEGQAQEITFQTLRSLGWTCNDVTELTGLGGTRVHAVEDNRTYEDSKGRTRQAKGWKIFAIKQPRPTLEADKKASFAAQFKALAASIPAVERNEFNTGLSADALPPKVETPTASNGASTAASAAAGGSIPF